MTDITIFAANVLSRKQAHEAAVEIENAFHGEPTEANYPAKALDRLMESHYGLIDALQTANDASEAAAEVMTGDQVAKATVRQRALAEMEVSDAG